MNSNSIKIDSSRLFKISGTPDECFACTICQDISLNPKECLTCQNLFCEDCILEWQKLKDSCPFQCKGALKLGPAHKFVRNAISQLKFHCKNRKLGCEGVFNYENLLIHEKKTCDYELIICDNIECQQQIFRKDIKEHEKICMESGICEFCKKQYNSKSKHNCIQTLLGEINDLKFKEKKNEEKIIFLEEQLQKKYSNVNECVEKALKEKLKDLKNFLKKEIHLFMKDNEKKLIKKEKNKNEEIKKENTEINNGKENYNEKKEDPIEDKSDILDNYFNEWGNRKSKIGNCHKNYDDCIWLIDSANLNCSSCSQKRLIRYQCKICNQYICVKCKIPQFIDKKCPLSHQMSVHKNKGESVCDICLKEIKNKENCWKDLICDVDICMKCFL